VTTQPIEFERPAGANGVAAPTAPEVVLLDAPAIAAPLPDLAYLVREIGLVADAGPPHLVAGYGFSGKTLAMQSLALSLTAARPVWGFYSCPDPRRVVHVDYEQGERLTRIRYKRLARAMGIDLASMRDAIALAVMPPIRLAREHTAHWHKLMAGRDLIIVDSLRAATAGEDENSSQIRGALDMLGEVSERTGCRALIIHHARKPSDDAPAGGRFAIRGSSAIYDASDSAYVLSANKGDAIRVAHERAKSHGETVEDFALVISDVPMDGDPKAGSRSAYTVQS
jgi:RecA-family ATPase